MDFDALGSRLSILLRTGAVRSICPGPALALDRLLHLQLLKRRLSFLGSFAYSDEIPQAEGQCDVM